MAVAVLLLVVLPPAAAGLLIGSTSDSTALLLGALLPVLVPGRSTGVLDLDLGGATLASSDDRVLAGAALAVAAVLVIFLLLELLEFI